MQPQSTGISVRRYLFPANSLPSLGMPITRRTALVHGLAATCLAGCGNPLKGSSESTIGLSFETLQTEYWETSFRIFLQELRKQGQAALEAVADGDASRQLDQVLAFIRRGASGIIVAPKDSTTAVPLVKHANRAGVPIVFYNRPPAENAGRYTAVLADNAAIAETTVTHMAELARARGIRTQAMILLGDLGDMNAVGRRDGFDAALKPHADAIEVVARVPTDWNQEKAQAGATAALAANPGINFIFSSSDFLFPSLVSALRSVGKYHRIGHPEHVILGGFDGDSTAYRMLVDGYLDADGVQDLYFECAESVAAILNFDSDRDAATLIRDEGFVAHQRNLDQLKTRMWGASSA